MYDVSKYLDDHPGGSEIIVEYAGKDATDMFEDIGHSSEVSLISLIDYFYDYYLLGS